MNVLSCEWPISIKRQSYHFHTFHLSLLYQRFPTYSFSFPKKFNLETLISTWKHLDRSKKIGQSYVFKLRFPNVALGNPDFRSKKTLCSVSICIYNCSILIFNIQLHRTCIIVTIYFKLLTPGMYIHPPRAIRSSLIWFLSLFFNFYLQVGPIKTDLITE